MATRINTLKELEEHREQYKKALSCQHKQILICAGTGCVAGGSLNIYAKLKQIMDEKGIACSLKLEK